ncbi:hypothetical protein [Aureimonas fodinaquatilis]|uniref:hypothetical protein n=1 Tax=Aureimonas fodinaquatilis TaxID=2565783 RepID=UPI0011EE6128|nr:hypothetical protein [Aureimonas fodinaquatilis]
MMDGGYHPQRILYDYRQPRSSVILRECTKSFAREQVNRGVHPKGSIWVPGNCEGSHARPEMGDLFGPDPAWKPATPLNAVPDDHIPYQTR